MPKMNAEYVMHDGELLPLDKLVSMAKQAGSYAHAEHYIVSIMYHAIVTQQPHLAVLCNEIRAYYHLAALPGSPPASAQNMPRQYTAEEIVRQKFEKMSRLTQIQVIRESLSQFWLLHQQLFVNKECWIGIYLVIHDRLDQQLSKTNFFTIVVTATPEEWPKDKRISTWTMSNYGRKMIDVLRSKTYYEMGFQNPWRQLCNHFWEILMDHIMTNF